MYRNNSYLFSKYDLRKVLEGQEIKLSSEIEGYDRNYILNVSINDVCDYLEDKHRIKPIDLKKDSIYLKQHGDASIDVSHDHDRVIFDRNAPFYIKGISVTFAIPFEGEADLFYCQASTHFLNVPKAIIEGNEILLTFQRIDPNAEQIKAEFEKELSIIEKNVSYINNDINNYFKGFREGIIGKIEARKAKLLKDQGMVESLGYPIKPAADVPKTYTVPTIKKKISLPTVTMGAFVPEPGLDLKTYEEIIKIITNMVLVMERSPHAFTTMDEESLRQHFLVQLNGHFEGAATGETFNYQGKTDIIIKEKDKNLFIAECLIWGGPKSLSDKIDQLLGYTSWRDTKTAILIFNRNKDFSNVLAQIPDIVKKHKNFKKQLTEYKMESGFRFIMHQNQDVNRELILTVLAYDIPTT